MEFEGDRMNNLQKGIDRITITRNKAAAIPGLEEDVARFDGLLDELKLKLEKMKKFQEKLNENI